MARSKRYDRILIDFNCLAFEAIAQARLLSDRPQDLLNKWQPGVPSIAKVAGISASSLWRKIKAAGAAHFTNMPPQAWAVDLFGECRTLADSVEVVSGPPYFYPSRNGRSKWVREHFGRETRYVAINQKQQLAGPRVLLIDGSEVACKFFIEAGGRAVLFPLHFNALHNVVNPLTHVFSQMKGAAA